MKHLLILCSVFFSISASAQTCDCAKYKTGKFELDNQNGTISQIVRTKKFQTETMNDSKLKDEVVWVDDCTYKVIPLKRKDETGMIGDQVMVFHFIETLEHAYVVHVTLEGVPDFSVDVKVYEKGYLNYDIK